MLLLHRLGDVVLFVLLVSDTLLAPRRRSKPIAGCIHILAVLWRQIPDCAWSRTLIHAIHLFHRFTYSTTDLKGIALDKSEGDSYNSSQI